MAGSLGTTFSVAEFLKKHEEEFFKVVDPKRSLLRLSRKGVITSDVKSSINASNNEDAAEILYDHLKCHGNVTTLREYCEVAINADGLPNMQTFGRKMKKDLPLETITSVEQPMTIQLLHNQQWENYTGLQYNETFDSIEMVDDHLEWRINHIAKQGKWPSFAVRQLYHWVCKRVADSLDGRLEKIKDSVEHHCTSIKDPPYDRLSEEDLKCILSCTSVDRIMMIIGISQKWFDVSFLEGFFCEMADPMAPSKPITMLWLDRYKQLLQYVCCRVLLREAPGDHELLQVLLKDVETSLESSRLLAVMHELDYKYFSAAQLLELKECLEKILNVPPGHLKCIRVESGHSVAIYWLIDKCHIARVMLDGRWIFWPLLEHHVISLELVGSLTMSLKGGHVPYLIRDALLTGQNLIQQTEVFSRQFLALVGPPDQSLENSDSNVRHRRLFKRLLEALASDRSCLQGTKTDPKTPAAVIETGPADTQTDDSASLPLEPELPTPQHSKVDEDVSQTQQFEQWGKDRQYEVESEELVLDVSVALHPGQSATDRSKPQEDKGQELAKKQQHPKKGRKAEREHKRFREQFPAASVKPARSKVAAQQFPLSHETSATSLKRPTLVPASPTLQASGEALKHPTVAQKYGALPEAIRPTKHPPSVMAEVSEAAHYEAIGVVDHPHPGQGGDFDDEGPATLSGKRDKDRSKGHTFEIKAEYFALVCAPCLEQLSDKTRMRRLGECTSKGHVKKMIVRPEDGRFVPVRRQTLPNGQICQKTLCQYYPNCYEGDMCQLAHGEEELGYWTGMYKEKKELCLDCRSQAAEHVVQQCQVNGHEATVVVYSDAEKRELVPVYWPVNASKVRWFTVKADHVRTCCDRMKCSLPHHYLERRILNLWREVTVATDSRPSPRMFLAELKRAVAVNIKTMDKIPEEQLSEEYREDPIAMEDYSYPKTVEESAGEQWQDDVSIVEDRDRITPKAHTLIKAERFALICELCSSLVSDDSPNLRNPLGTCGDKTHIKKMIVRCGAQFIPVRRSILPSGQSCKWTPCKHYPNCFDGDMCERAHGDKELDYWKGNLRPEYELCLDCKLRAAERILHNCHSDGHKPATVLYVDEKCREIVQIPLPGNIDKMSKGSKFRVTHLPNDCRNPQYCSFPHHQLAAKIMNRWREVTVAVSKPPNLKRYFEELQLTWQLQTQRMKVLGPRPKEELEAELKLVADESLTCANYVQKFHLLIDLEEHTHMETLATKYNGTFTFVRVSNDQKHKMLDQPYEWVGVLFMSSLKAHPLRQAATAVTLHFMNGATLIGDILQYPDWFNSEPCLALGFPPKSNRIMSLSMTTHKGTVSPPQLESNYWRVDAEFILKHSYFTSLRKSLSLVPTHVVQRLVPSKVIVTNGQCENCDTAVIESKEDYPVLDNFNLDEEYQEAAFAKVMQADSSAPFIITGPFGAGKTRLIATTALRILLHNADRFILIATHHNKTATEYIEKYYKPLLEKTFDHKENLGVVRIVNHKRHQDAKKVTGDEHRKQDEKLGTDDTPTVNSIEEYVKTVDELDSDDIDDYNLIITTFGVMLRLRTILKKKKCKFFTHIFVDEGAQAREPETLGAFCYAGSSTKIVIVGDHKQVGPQTHVLGTEARQNGLSVSLIARLHADYQKMTKAAREYQAVMLSNHRTHTSIMCLASSLFYESTIHSQSKSELHPDYKESVCFVCTSLDPFPACTWHDDEEYDLQVRKEVEAAIAWVKTYASNWPEVEWEKKDLGSLCVIVPNRHVERLWKKYAKDAQLIDVTCNVAYEIQGREFRAIFICTSEAVDRGCATRDPVKSLCDQYVFNTIITRARSLVMAFGNPFRLMEIERNLANEGGVPNPQASSSPVMKCWETLFYYCLQCNSLVLSEDLGQQRQESRQCALEQSTRLLEVESVMFERATAKLLKLDQIPESTVDGILNVYNKCFEDRNKKMKLNTTGGQFAWKYGSSEPVRPPPMEAHVPPGTRLIECRLWQDTQHQCIAVPLDPKEKLLQVKGVENRRRAFEGALVKVRVLDQSGDYGAVHTVEEQGSVEPQICEIDRLSTNVFFPVDKKSPRIVNLPYIARNLFEGSVTGEAFEKDQERREQYVVCFDPVHLKADQVPKISHIIPKEVASHLLFVVCPLRWSWEHRYPLGAVVAALPKGISELYANKVLSIQYQIPAPGSDTELHGVDFVEESPPTVFTTAIGIVSQGGHSSVALSVDSKGPDGYVVGIHVCNVADLVEQSEEFKKAAFHRWAGVFDQSEEVYHPTLPKGIVQGLSFTNGGVKKSIACNVQVRSPGIGKLLMSTEVLTEPQNIALQHTFEESTVNCGVMLEVAELEEMLMALFGNAHVHEQLQDKIATCTLPLWEMVTALYLLSDHLCFLRQMYRGYPELQQVPEAFLYPEAWKLLHELLTYASSKAASFIGTTFRSETLLKVQAEPPQENRQKICDEFAFLLKFTPFYQWMTRLDNIQLGSPDFVCTESNYQILLNALQRFDVLAFRQLFMQPYHHPQLGVLEARIREALPREEFAVKKIASKSKQVRRRAVEDLIEDAGGKHHSLQGIVSPYSAPFDNVFDIYIQYMLLRAIRKQRHTKDGSTEVQPSGLTPNLSSVVRFCNMATANSKKYDSSVASLKLAIHGQWSSICVETFVKEMKDGNIQLCYPDPALQSIFSVQAIETKYVTSSKKAKFVLYTARVTCVDKPCYMLSNIHDYTFLPQPIEESEEEAKTASMSIFYHKEGRLAKCHIAPHYESPTVSLSETVWHEAIKFVVNPQKKDAGELRQFLNQNIIREETIIETVQASQKATEEEVRGAPLFILKMPFLLTPCQVVKVWLRTDMNEYVLTPKPQLIELNSDIRICLQHKSDILSCFTQCAFAEPSKAQYSSYTTYSKIWGELVLAEAAYNSVNGTDQYIFTDFQLNFSGFHIPSDCTSEEFYEPIGDIWTILPQKFLARLQDIFPIEQGYFACFRFDVELKEDEEEDRALLERHKDRLYPGATDNHVRTVMHMVVDRVTKVEDKEEEEVRMTLEERVIQHDLMVKFKVVGRHNARLSPLMKDVLEIKKPRCEMQVFQMFLPIRKVYQAFQRLTQKDGLVADVALGRLNRLVGPGSESEFSAEAIKNLLLQNRYVLQHWDESGIVLNDTQTKTLMSALMNRFQLIQGPPGTGKSITGAHIAYAFALLNRERKRSQAEADEAVEQAGMMHDPSGLPPLECVLYCGPSNASVDVVLDHLDGIARTSADSGGLRILRLYGKSIEKQHHDHPYLEEDLFGKTVEYDIKQKLQIYCLHQLVRSESSYKKKIKELEDKFRALHEKGFIPIADERFEYRDWIRKAEEEIIKRGNFDILLCTCNETSGSRFRSNVSPIQCIIDEAGMTTEPEAIVALSQAEQAVLIGDHMQLQPVVKCREAAANGLEVSLFERYACLFRKKYPEGCPNFQQLLKQYRMVPAICEFPSETFYESTLITKCTSSFPINEFWLPKSSGPIVFCDVVGTEEDEESKEEIKNSKKNEKEADKTVEVVRAIDALTRSEASIAVITPYKAQKLLITKKLGKLKENWTVMTVDASQGSEADFVVLSMVRSKAMHEIEDKTLVQADTQWIRESLGIVADSHRLCVALTRARFGLVIIGNQTLLSYDELWSRLIAHCKDHKYFVYRSELHRFPPKGPVNQAKAAAAAVGKVGKEKKPKSHAVALKQKPADEKVRVHMEFEMELTPDEIVTMLEALEEFRKNILQSKPLMWQELRKKKKEIKESSSAGGDSKQVLT